MIGFALCGSFCTVRPALREMERLKEKYEVQGIVSEAIYHTDTRFAPARVILDEILHLTGRELICDIVGAEPLGPAAPLEALIICPCTGNTLAKMANGITDSCVTMAAKAHLRCDRPLIIAISTNDALSQNLKNIGTVLTRKSVYFVPFGQDSPLSKPHSLISDFSLMEKTVEYALGGKQLQPLLI